MLVYVVVFTRLVLAMFPFLVTISPIDDNWYLVIFFYVISNRSSSLPRISDCAKVSRIGDVNLYTMISLEYNK